ncbi:excinuclease ABC subunit UvrC [Kribbella sp. CA-293567]|uniref:excinuclease ABC subunit UvrC n=1 Tax=Kribbella sp. CA-293567 TaxID=3002436 RepID=UPI0022DE0C92|nr:excinuclease ABC subunit UvrC [Kribbella sp. CA-293567]WBQ08540.1 excinuclease ABC subunit UvrC [Kribbella sp. CA-293567]
MADPSSYRPAPGSIPDSPGVYRFSDAAGRVIYVGKAKNLRARLSSYFQDLVNLHTRTQTMVTTAAKVDWTVVANEVESLQLEYSWIKEYDPRFNVKYRDDKSYPWLAITLNEEYPRVMVGRGPKKKGVRYFGPYSHAWAIRETVDLLLRVFPMRSCSKGVFNRHRQMGRPCLLGYIGKCAAPCIGQVSQEEHRKIVEDFSAFLSGQTTTYVRRLEKEMKAAAAELEYERAAKIRDDLGALDKALAKNAVVLGDDTDTDVIALSEDPLEVAVQIFYVRGGRIRGQRGWIADKADGDATTADLVERFIQQTYAGDGADTIPREILVPTLPAGEEALIEWLSEFRGSRVSIRVPQRGDKKDLMATVERNALQTLTMHKTKRASDLTTRNLALEEIQAALDLPEVPLRMECYDVSNLQGTEVVASMVVFEDGLPRKSEYRRFVIKGVEGQNDVASIAEVLTRRFKRMIEDRAGIPEGEDPTAYLIDPDTGRAKKFAYTPSLVVVDGGPPQVAAARQAMDELGLGDIPVCGLAKRLEEVWLPDDEDPVIFSRTSEGLYLLQRLRDEAHRFAITHHRNRRSKSMVESVLDEVSGLGDVRRKTLLKHFGSLKKLRQASIEEVAELPGFGRRTAESVVLAVNSAATKADTGRAPSVNTATGEILEDDVPELSGTPDGDRTGRTEN